MQAVADRFRMAMPVMDHAADDEEMPAFAESLVRGDDWRACVKRAGGRPVGEPEIRREPNPCYGMVITDEDGQPLLGHDGEPLVDHVKLYIVASGFAERVS